MLSAMFHRGILLAAISAIALLILAFFVAVVAYVLWPVTIAVIVIYAIGLVANIITGKKVADFMSRDVVSLKPDTTVEDAARVMISSDFRRVPIVHEGVMIGVVTTSDIVKYLGSGEVFDKLVTGNMHEALGVPIRTIARDPPITVDPDLDLGEAADLMIARNVSVLPVVVEGALAGIITERDFLNAIVD